MFIGVFGIWITKIGAKIYWNLTILQFHTDLSILFIENTVYVQFGFVKAFNTCFIFCCQKLRKSWKPNIIEIENSPVIV